MNESPIQSEVNVNQPGWKTFLGGLMGSIPYVGGAIQSIINQRTQKRNVDLQNQENRKLAEYQYSKDLEMWNRANEYNTPANQMQRFKRSWS